MSHRFLRIEEQWDEGEEKLSSVFVETVLDGSVVDFNPVW